MKTLTILLLSLALSACENRTNAESKAKDTPETRKMLTAFYQQEHQLEFNGCEMLYNGTPFRLGMTVKELEEVFGRYDVFDSGRFFWKGAGIVFTGGLNAKEAINAETLKIYIYLNWLVTDKYKEVMDGVSYPEHDYFLLEGMPIGKSMQMRDFFKNSHYKLDDFSVSDRSYELVKKCHGPQVNLLYHISAEGGWIKKVVGHYIVKSHLDPDNAHTIDDIVIMPYED